MLKRIVNVWLIFLLIFSSIIMYAPYIDIVKAGYDNGLYWEDFDDIAIGTKNITANDNGLDWLEIEPAGHYGNWPAGVLNGTIKGFCGTEFNQGRNYWIYKLSVGADNVTVWYNLSRTTNFTRSLQMTNGNAGSNTYNLWAYYYTDQDDLLFSVRQKDGHNVWFTCNWYVYNRTGTQIDYYYQFNGGYCITKVNVSVECHWENSTYHIYAFNTDTPYRVVSDLWIDATGYFANISKVKYEYVWGGAGGTKGGHIAVDEFYAYRVPNTPPQINSFAVDTEPGANSGWDLDNDDVQIDLDYTDPEGAPVDMLFTFNKGSQARQPTTADYDARILTQSGDLSNYDLDWTGGTWSDYDGEVYVRCRLWDGDFYSDDDPPVLGVDYDYLDFGIDGTAPTTSANQITPYRVTTSTTTIEATASDSPSNDNIDYLNLYYVFSDDNATWGSWNDYGADYTPSPWGWTFNFPDGSGYYEFYTAGTDEAGNVETMPPTADARCLHNEPPTQENEYPDNESVIGDVEPTCWIRVVDPDYDLLDVYFYENTTGSWVLRQTYLDVASNTYQSFDYEQADASGATYWWRVTVDDSHETNTATYWFNISGGSCPYVNGVIPVNGSYVYTLYPGCQFDANDPDSETVDYEIWENTTGAWVRRQYGAVNEGDTVYWTYAQADAYNETYWWRVNVTDGECNRAYIYHFDLVINPPYNLQVINQSEDSLDVTWSKGPGTTHTLILYKEGSYPDNPYDGTAYTAYFGTGTSTTIGGLNNATTYYIRAWSYLSGEYSEEYDQTTGTTDEGDVPPGPSEPGGFVCRNVDETTRLLLQWNLGEDNWVHIRSATDTYPTTIYDGTFVYNGSGSVFYDSDLTPGELYYYSAFFESYADNTSLNITNPNPPTNLDLDVNSGSNFSVSWTTPTEGNFNTTVIRARNNTAPVNETDGDFFYNGTGSSCYAETNYYPYVFGAWSYVEEAGFKAYSERADMDDVEGNVVMNCYDEYTGDNITSWNVIITSNTGGTEHTGYNKNNPYIVDCGPWTSADYYTFKFTKKDYYSGWYSYTEDEIDTVVNFPIDCYMAEIGANGSGGGDDWYEILILNEYDIVVEGVRVALYHVTNETTGNKTLVSLWYTDNYGEVQFEGIIAGDEYYVNLSKEDYITSEYRWIPGEDDHYKTFKIYTIIPPTEDVYNPWDYITFTASFSDNTTLVVTYADTSGLTTDAYFRLYENNSATYFQTAHFYDSDETWTVPYDGTRPNANRADYRIKLFINNHSYFGNWTATIFTTKTETSYIQTLIDFDTNVVGIIGVPIAGSGIGWVSIIFFCIGIFIIVSFGRYWAAGVGVAALGLFIAFFAAVFGVPGLGVDQLIVFAAYCIIYGALAELAKQKRGRIA